MFIDFCGINTITLVKFKQLMWPLNSELSRDYHIFGSGKPGANLWSPILGSIICKGCVMEWGLGLIAK